MCVFIKTSFAGSFLGIVIASANAQTLPDPELNHNVAGWMSNRPSSTLEPDSYVCSPGNTIPTSTPVLPVTDRYDGRVISPSAMSFGTPNKHILLPEGTYPTLVQFQNLDAAPAETYVDFPFKTIQRDSDYVLNQALYAINSGTGYGSQFLIRMALVDGTEEFPLSGKTPMAAPMALPDGMYFFVNNQTWPLIGPAGPPKYQCVESTMVTNQGIPDTVLTPVPLKPDHQYKLRAYLSLEANATDTRAMIDDVMLFMQTVTTKAQDDGVLAGGGVDPAYSFAAANGGTTPSVLANDQINNLAVPSGQFTLESLSADAGITLNTSTGTIAALPGQPGTKTLTYKLCPKYNQTVVPNFQSSACTTATAKVHLTGPAAPPTVSITCTPAAIPDSVGGASVCTIKADTVVTNPLTVHLAPPTNGSRYQTDCGATIQIPGGSDQASCNITAVPNDTPGDGNATATIALVADPAYVIGTGTASVTVQDDDLSIVGSVQGAPAAFPPALVGQTVNYSLACAPGTATPASGQLTIGANGQLSAPATHVTPGTVCTGMTVDGVGQLPAAPTGYTWTSAVAATGTSNAFVVTLVMAPNTPPVTNAASPVPTLQAWVLAMLSLLIAGLGLQWVGRRKA